MLFEIQTTPIAPRIMYKLSLLTLALLSTLSVAQDTKVGYTGTLSSLDGGLGGTVSIFSESLKAFYVYFI